MRDSDGPRLATAIEIGAEAERLYPTGKFGEVSPDLSFLEQFGFTQALTISRWIEEVGVDEFVAIILAFADTSLAGRSESDYSKYIDQFDAVAAARPGAGDYPVAAEVVAKAYELNEWGSFRPPAAQKTMQETLVRKIRARRSPKKSKNTTNLEIESRVKRRAKAMAGRSSQLLATANLVKLAAPYLYALTQQSPVGRIPDEGHPQNT